MKRQWSNAVILYAVMFSTVVLAEGTNQACALVERSWAQYRRATCETEDTEITLSYDGGRKEVKRLTRWIQFDPAGEDKVTIVFSQPPNDDGLGLLTWRHPQGSDDQWLKLPSMKQVRRVSVSDQSKYFAGTDLTYEDARQLIGERTGDFSYSFAGETNGLVRVEALPRAGVNTGYGRRVLWFDHDERITRTDYYAADRTRLIKTQHNEELVTDEKGRWRVAASRIENVLLKRTTLLKIIGRKIDTPVSPNLFTRAFLESNHL
jgi:hypothetical protein